ncbi:BnaC04g26340D [Brassica napus]|uniref:BnaC04g26340D protein n=1 Tax=Brassica napus TaxID=3708 RepID=A0A078FJ47_BRANA|nr:BnaC04g26340D [Brassica napus]
MASTDCFLAHLSTSLFEEEEPPLMEVNGKEVDKSYYDGLSSLSVNPTNDTNSRALPINTGQDPSSSQAHPVTDHVMPELYGTTALDPHPETVPSTGSAQACSNTLLSDGGGAKDGNNEMAGGKRIVGFDGHGSYTEKDSGNSKEEKCVIPINEVSEAKDVDVDLIEIPDSELEITQTEACENAFESDEDLPNYSDIEAMILDMDLDPDDQDNFDLEVSKYSKHYIKKPEVLIIMLLSFFGSVGLYDKKKKNRIRNSIAIIQLGDDGSFHIKNLGKYSISVNEKEVDPGHSLILKSDCLLEIRGMPFIFETNQSRMKEYLKKITGKGN